MVELYFSAVTVISARPASSLLAAVAAAASLPVSVAKAHSLAQIPDSRPRTHIEFQRALRRAAGQDAWGIGDSSCCGPICIPLVFALLGRGRRNVLFPVTRRAPKIPNVIPMREK